MSDTLENQLQQILDIKNDIADTINVTVAVGDARSVTWRATSTSATCYISALRYRRLGKK